MGRRKHETNHSPEYRNKQRKLPLIGVIAIILLVALPVCGTLAFLIAETGVVTNRFSPAYVDCSITEEFNGEIKKNVNVTNDGDVGAYIRVKLLSYRVNADGARIGGAAAVPAFTPGDGWKLHDGFYYYTAVVPAKGEPASDLIGTQGITLQAYTDDDGGYQVIEVLAEAIQASGNDAAGDAVTEVAWGVTIADGNVTTWSKN